MKTILQYREHEFVRDDDEDMQGQYFCKRYVESMIPGMKETPYLEVSLTKFPGSTEITFRWTGVYLDEKDMISDEAYDKGTGAACGHDEAEDAGETVVWVKNATATVEGDDPVYICSDQPWMVAYLLQEEFPSTNELRVYVAPCKKPNK